MVLRIKTMALAIQVLCATSKANETETITQGSSHDIQTVLFDKLHTQHKTANQQEDVGLEQEDFADA